MYMYICKASPATTSSKELITIATYTVNIVSSCRNLEAYVHNAVASNRCSINFKGSTFSEYLLLESGNMRYLLMEKWNCHAWIEHTMTTRSWYALSWIVSRIVSMHVLLSTWH